MLVSEQLARIGNGVVPAQAYMAFKLLPEARQQWEHDHGPAWARPIDEPVGDTIQSPAADTPPRLAVQLAA